MNSSYLDIKKIKEDFNTHVMTLVIYIMTGRKHKATPKNLEQVQNQTKQKELSKRCNHIAKDALHSAWNLEENVA